MKRITVFRTTVCILVAVMLCGVLGGCSAGEVTEPVFEDNKTLHIGAWIAPPPGYITDENYQAIADAGINCIYALYEGADSNGIKALELAGTTSSLSIKTSRWIRPSARSRCRRICRSAIS